MWEELALIIVSLWGKSMALIPVLEEHGLAYSFVGRVGQM
jgi:hypothetical protein